MNLQTGSKNWLRHNVPLSNYTTMQVGGPAGWFAEPSAEEELLEALAFAREQNLPFIVLGKGSNVVFPDEGYPGLVISLLHFQKKRIIFDDVRNQVCASGGVYLYRLVLACRDRGFGGLEFLASIPGTLGGAAVMNAGFSRFPGQKSEIGDLIDEVSVVTAGGSTKVCRAEDLRFSYRFSNLMGHVVTQVKLNLWRRKPEQIEEEIRACFRYRNMKQDLSLPSSGSIFKNPPKPLPAAAALIDRLGLKGTRVGGVMISEKHGNYLVNTGNAKAAEIIDLIQLIRRKVFDAEGIRLEPEVRIIKGP